MALSELLIVKIATLFVLLFGSFLVACLPIVLFRWTWLRRWRHMKTGIKVLKTCEGLAGGILFGVALLHLLPEANEQIQESIMSIIESKELRHNATAVVTSLALHAHSRHVPSSWRRVTSEGEDVHGEEEAHEHDHHHHAPWYATFAWSFLLAGLSLLSIQFMENVIMKFVEHYKSEDCTHPAHTIPESGGEPLEDPQANCVVNAATAVDAGLETVDAVIGHEQHIHGHHEHTMLQDVDMDHEINSITKYGIYRADSLDSPTICPLDAPASGSSDDDVPQLRKRTDTTVTTTPVEVHDSHYDNTAKNSVSDQERHEVLVNERRLVLTKFLNTMILWLSTCLHAFFEGLGLGSQTKSEEMWTLFGAIVAHKAMESFALGIIVEKGIRGRCATNRLFLSHLIWMIVFLVSFTLATPVGIAIGIGISEKNTTSSPVWTIVVNLLLSLAGGAFIHISLFEILNGHSHDHSHGHSHAHAHHGDSSTSHHHTHHAHHDHAHSHSHNSPTEQHTSENKDHHDHEEDLHEHFEGGKQHPLWALSKFTLFVVGFIAIGALGLIGHSH